MITHHLHIQRLVIVVLAGIAVVLIGFVASAVFGARQSASANSLAGVAAVAAGESNSCFLLTDATVKCTGDNFGPVPAVVPGLSEPVGAITAGTSHMCALTQAGGVKCWGGSFGASPVNVAGETSNVVAIGAGSNYTCALDTGGGVSCWGGGNLGKLAGGVLSSGVTSLGTGYQHSCALLSGGTVKCWGKNDNGQLGDGTTFDSASPVTVQGLSNATAVAAGINHSCALTVAGGVVCWGHTYGNAPVTVSGLTSGVTAISASYLHTCALLTGGAVKCWGDNVFGELGDGLACGIQCAQPTNPEGLTAGVAQVSAGDYHTCVALVSGGAKCWGINFSGQLGAGMLTNSTRPLDVVLAMVKSPPTPTPCPIGGCPTPTPTPTGPPLTGIDWSLSIDVDHDGRPDCSTKGTDSDTCTVPAGSSFSVQLSLDALSQKLPRYVGFDSRMFFAGVQSKQNSTVSWPECDDPATAYSTTWIALGCNISAGLFTTGYVGPMGASGFSCSASGAVTLTHGSGETDLWDQHLHAYYEGNPSSETLTIDCIDPLADYDGDGCPNGQELSSDVMAGGRRDPYNPWDYFNPSQDGKDRVDDILLVVHKYFEDAGSSSYAMATDRTEVGPNLWSLGPPNGQQRVDDILNSVHQFFHDCG